MSTRILKVTIAPFDGYVGRIDKPGRVVHVGWQGDDVCVWLETEPGRPSMPLLLAGFATGEEVDPGWSYVGTAQAPDKPLVIHVFQQRVEPAPEFEATTRTCATCAQAAGAPFDLDPPEYDHVKTTRW